MMGFHSPDSSSELGIHSNIIKFPELKRFDAQKKILLVDDDEDIRVMLRFTISKVFPHVQIVEAPSGLLASVKLAKAPYDLVISDVNMLDGDGIWLHFVMEQYHSTTPLVFFACSPEHIPAVARSRKVFAKTDANGLVNELIARWNTDETR